MYISAVCLCDDWCVNHSCVFDVEGHLLIDGSTVRDLYPVRNYEKKKSVRLIRSSVGFRFLHVS